jgi:MoxR-like ATPase
VTKQATSRPPAPGAPAALDGDKLRLHAEQEFAAELQALAEVDNKQRPPRWKLSPWAVKTYLLGGTLENGFEVTPKYIGNERLIEIAVATLATDRALLLYGLPGTAKSWVSEHLAAAISGTSTLLIQGTAGTDEATLRYGWNYARLLAEGPSRGALVESPMLKAMEAGLICRVEEMTRMPGEVQDTLITILSEKTLPVPELNIEVQASKGFNVIATANNRDKGVNELSSALLRRFNTVVLPVPDSLDDEVKIVNRRSEQLGRALELPVERPALDEIRRVVTILRELRNGVTEDGKTKLKSPSGTLSAAEAISVVTNGMAISAFYGDGQLRAADIISSLIGAIVKDPVQDQLIWQEYVQIVIKERDDWKDLYRATRDLS